MGVCQEETGEARPPLRDTIRSEVMKGDRQGIDIYIVVREHILSHHANLISASSMATLLISPAGSRRNSTRIFPGKMIAQRIWALKEAHQEKMKPNFTTSRQQPRSSGMFAIPIDEART